MANNITKLSTQFTASAKGFEAVANSVEKRIQSFGKKRVDIIADVNKKHTSAVPDIANKMKPTETALQRIRGRFNSGLQSANRFFDGLLKGASKLPIVGGIIAFAASAIGVTFVSSMFTAAIASKRFAESIGDSSKNIMALQHSARSVGANIDHVNDGLEHFTRLVTEAGYGNDVAARTIANTGLRYEELADKLPTEQLKIAADKFKSLQTASEKASFAYQLFGDKADEMLPLLQQGSKGLTGLAAEAERLGFTMDDLEVRKIEEGRIAWDRLQFSLENLVMKYGRQLAPIFQSVISRLEKLANTADALGTHVDSLGDVLNRAYKYGSQAVAIADNLVGSWGALSNVAMGVYTVVSYAWHSLTATIAKSAYEIVSSVNDVLKSFNLLSSVTPLSGINDRAKGAMEAQEKNLAKSKADLEQLYGRINQGLNDLPGANMPGKDFTVLTGVNKAAEEREKLAAIRTEIAKTMELSRKAMAIRDNVTSPVEKYAESMRGLDEMLNKSKLSWVEYGRAVNQATSELESALGLNSISLPTIQRKDTAGAIETVNRSRVEHELKNLETPQKRLERLQTASNEYAKRTAEYTEEIAKAAKARAVLQLPPKGK